MKDEIKEILDRAKKLKYKCTCCEQIGEGVYISKYHEIETQNLIEAVYIIDKLLDYITNLQEENKHLDKVNCRLRKKINNDIYKSRNEKAIEYITSYEAISTIQGLDKIEQNKKLDERTMNVMVERYLKVHHNLLNILQGEDKDVKNS